jgi:hypothetical protein
VTSGIRPLLSSKRMLYFKARKSLGNNNRGMVMSPETKIDCAGEGRQQCTQPKYYKKRVTGQENIGHDSCGVIKQ